MKRYRLVREQLLHGRLEEVFQFFSNAGNLEAITPPWLGFRILTPLPIEMREGTLLRYRLRLAGMPVSWRTRIARWEPPGRFVDVQEAGPYALWRHTHEFRARGDEVLMRDVVRYALPLGSIGSLVHALIVRWALGRIFDYRFAVLEKRFAREGSTRA